MSILPQSKSQPKHDLGEFVTLLYGPPKVGKTTFASQFPDAVFLATEAGQNALSVARVDIDSWDKFIEACGELAQGKHHFKTVVIDTVDNLWQLCRQHFLAKYNVEHETDNKLGYGKGSSLILSEFQRALTKLSMLNLGLLMISHADRENIEIKTATTEENYQRWVPAVAAKARISLMGMADFLLFADFTGPRAEPMIYTKASKYWTAGDRSGRLPEKLPLQYTGFLQAFKAAMGTATQTTQANQAKTNQTSTQKNNNQAVAQAAAETGA